MNIKNRITEHYRKFFDLHAKGIALDEDDRLNIDWAEDLVKNCFIPNVINWVACKDELPEISDWVLCCNTEDEWTDFADIHHNGHGKKVFWNRECEVYPTHWAKLPKPPCL